MSRRMIASIAAALALAPLSAFAADKAPAHRHMDHDQNCSCSQVASSTATSPAGAPSRDKLADLGGQNGFANSYDSP